MRYKKGDILINDLSCFHNQMEVLEVIDNEKLRVKMPNKEATLHIDVIECAGYYRKEVVSSMNILDKINVIAEECEENKDTFLIMYSDGTPEHSQVILGGNGVNIMSGIAKVINHIANSNNVSDIKKIIDNLEIEDDE